MRSEFYSGTMKKTKLNYEDLVSKYDIHEGRIVKSIQKLAILEMHFDAPTSQMLLLKKGPMGLGDLSSYVLC